MTVRILLIGDLHLGRRPSRLPEGIGIRVEELTPAAAFENAWKFAIAEGVDVVALAGDVVENIEDRFEASAHLERGFKALLEKGVSVVAVAGNHDVQALPRLADLIEGFHLLGRDGSFEVLDVPARGGLVRFIGRSFRESHERRNPLDLLEEEEVPRDDVPLIGLLHCDTTQGSAYAPIRLGDLDRGPAARVDAWFLGHIHEPDPLAGPRPRGYLGSLTGMNPKESGRHGPWLAEVKAKGNVAVRQIPLAPIRYERLEVDVSEIEDGTLEDVQDALASRFRRALEALAEDLAEELGDTRVLACRAILEGRTGAHRHIDGIVRAWNRDREAMPLVHHAGATLFVEAIVDRSASAMDLEALARGDDPVGLCARRILILEENGPAARSLVEAFEKQAEERLRSTRLPVAPPDDTDAAACLLKAAYGLLERLLAQQENDPAEVSS